MSKVYTAAVVGAGTGGKLSMRGALASERIQLIAVADWSADARREAETLAPGVRTFPDHREMFQACQPDVVCVSTWPPSHLAVTRDALGLAIRGMLVEKPLADNSADGSELLRLIRDRGLPVVVPHGLLVSRHVQEILQRVHAGEIGDLELVEIQCTGWDIINAGIHWLDFFVALVRGDPVEWVMACCDKRTRTYRDGMQVETLAVTYAQTQSGVRVVMNTGDYVHVSEPGKGVLFHLVGTRGTLDFYAWEPRYRLLNETYPRGTLIEVDPGPRSAHQKYLEMLVDHMESGDRETEMAEHSLAALALCEAAYLSARHGCTVHLPLAEFSPPEPNAWEPGQPYSGQGGGRDGRQLPPREEGER